MLGNPHFPFQKANVGLKREIWVSDPKNPPADALLTSLETIIAITTARAALLLLLLMLGWEATDTYVLVLETAHSSDFP